MLININKEKEVINQYSSDKVIYSTKIVDELPIDIEEYVYKYINGELVRDRAIDFNYKSQKEINEQVAQENADISDYILDLDMRLIELEFLGGSYDL